MLGRGCINRDGCLRGDGDAGRGDRIDLRDHCWSGGGDVCFRCAPLGECGLDDGSQLLLLGVAERLRGNGLQLVEQRSRGCLK